MGVEIEVHEGGWESEEQSERERGERERGGKKACVYSLGSTQLPISPKFRRLDGKLPCDQEGRSEPPDSL